MRVPDPLDRRVTRVSITRPATRSWPTCARKDLWLASRLAELDDDQRDRLAAALDVIDALTLQERRDAGGPGEGRRARPSPRSSTATSACSSPASSSRRSATGSRWSPRRCSCSS